MISADSATGPVGQAQIIGPSCELKYLLFGYHPYWMGSAYLNYQWNLLSDLCYFSYEVDPATGEAITYHDWLNDPAIDSALVHGVRVHLCVTLFSGHSTFFGNAGARSVLISNLISLVAQRGAHGINLDFEAVPSSLAGNLSSFVAELSDEMETQIPEALLSIAIPAVNWNGTFQISALSDHIDLFMVMAYDYYWNGSGTAGPVSPFFSLTPAYDYSISRTISAYLAEGLSPEKFVLGVPYYGRQWITQSSSIPSPVLANGIALTFANIKNNAGGYYNSQNYYWEPGSFSSCFVFFQNGNWNQCFIGLERDIQNSYDAIVAHNLAGGGIWALGYDNGHTGLWQAIADKLTDCAVPVLFDTLFDSGGPAWNYYANEDYTVTVGQGQAGPGWLTFQSFQTEAGYDSLWIYAGSDTLATLLGAFSGPDDPGSLMSPDGIFTLRFRSDALGHPAGWEIVYHDGSMGTGDRARVAGSGISVYPNPSSGLVNLEWKAVRAFSYLVVTDVNWKVVFHKKVSDPAGADHSMQIDLSDLPGGNYYVVFYNDKGEYEGVKLLMD